MRESLPFDAGRQFFIIYLPTHMSAKGTSETVRESHIPPQVIYSDGSESFRPLIVGRLSYVVNEKEKDLWGFPGRSTG